VDANWLFDGGEFRCAKSVSIPGFSQEVSFKQEAFFEIILTAESGCRHIDYSYSPINNLKNKRKS